MLLNLPSLFASYWDLNNSLKAFVSLVAGVWSFKLPEAEKSFTGDLNDFKTLEFGKL